jgi:hypothetical protein
MFLPAKLYGFHRLSNDTNPSAHRYNPYQKYIEDKLYDGLYPDKTSKLDAWPTAVCQRNILGQYPSAVRQTYYLDWR